MGHRFRWNWGSADVDAVVTIGGMAEDSFVLFVEGVYGPPSERDPLSQFACVGGQVYVLPRRSRGVLPTRLGSVPGRKPEVGVPGGVLVPFQDFWRDVVS